MTPLKMAVVGVGALGRHHARILSELDSVELVAVAEIDAETGNRIAEQCQTQWVADYQPLVDQVDAVTIAVPTTYHLGVASEFLQRGIPVLVEKPLACSAEEAEYLVNLAEKHQAILQVGHVERFNPASQITADLCGSPKYIRAERLSRFAFRSMDIGVVHDLMIHDIDLVLSLVGEMPKRVEAFGVGIMGGHEDTVQARLTFPSGCIADLTANRVNPFPRRSMQIWSNRGCVTVDFTSREVVSYSPSETLLYGASPVERAKIPGAEIEQLKHEVFESLIKVQKPVISDADALTAELQSFVDCIREDRQPLVDGQQALEAMLIAEQILDSAAAYQWKNIDHESVQPSPVEFSQRKRAA